MSTFCNNDNISLFNVVVKLWTFFFTIRHINQIGLICQMIPIKFVIIIHPIIHIAVVFG